MCPAPTVLSHGSPPKNPKDNFGPLSLWHARGLAPIESGDLLFTVFFFPNSVSTLRGSYGRSKGRSLIRVVTLGRGSLPINFRIKWLLWTAQARTKCASAFWAQSGPRHFSGKFLYKVALLMSLVTCGHVFRLCRLAQSVCPRSGPHLGRGIFPVNFCKQWLL